jgi:hypothetical protein
MKLTALFLAFAVTLAMDGARPTIAAAQPPPPAAQRGAGSGARLQLDSLDRLAERAADVVNLTIDPEMLKLAGAFMKGQGDEAKVKELLSDLRGIYVRSFEFDQDQSYGSDLEAVRTQLAAPGWSRLVTADSRRDRELVEIYSWREGNAPGGLAIVVAEPRELTVVNIVGPIDLTKLGALQGQFGIPPLPQAK